MRCVPVRPRPWSIAPGRLVGVLVAVALHTAAASPTFAVECSASAGADGDQSPAPIAAALTVGPDGFGYIARDETEPGGPAFGFIDISTTGTRLEFVRADVLPVRNLNADEGVATAVALGFPFRYYGATHTTVNVSTNGFLHFDLNAASAAFNNECPGPSASQPNNRIAVLWDDLVMANAPSTGSGGYTQQFASCPNASGGTGPCTVIMWDNAVHYAGGSTGFDFEAILYSNGNILLQYAAGNPEHGSGSTTGLENAAGTVGVTYACNTVNSIPDGRAVLFTSTDPGGLLYVLSDRVAGNQVYAYRVNETTGALTTVPGFPVATGGTGTQQSSGPRVAVDAVNRRLFVINSGSLTVSAFAIDASSGALTALPYSPIALGGVPFPIGTHWTTVAVHPSGSLVVVAGSAFDARTVKSFVVTGTTATEAAGSPYTGRGNAKSSTFSRDGLFYYVSEDRNVAAYGVTVASGALTSLGRFDLRGNASDALVADSQGRLLGTGFGTILAATTSAGVPTAVTGSPFASGLGYGSDGALHPNGQFYFTAAYADNRVGSYRIAGTGAATTVTAAPGSPFVSQGDDPNGLALTGSGAFLYAANRYTRNLTTFMVNPGTGALTSVVAQPSDALGTTGWLMGVVYVPSAADVQLSMTAAPGTSVPGGTLTYTMRVTNAGPAGARDVLVTHVVPAHTTFLSATQTDGSAFTIASPPVGAAGAVTLSRSVMAVESATFAIAVRVNASAPVGTLVTGTASVVSPDPDPDMGNNTSTATTTLAACTITATPPSRTVAARGGMREVTFRPSDPSCAAPPFDNSGFLTALTPVANLGGGTVTYQYTVTPHTGAAARVGTITSGATAHTVRQQAPPTVTITSPTAAATFTATTPSLALSGTASDDTAVLQVRWTNDRGGSGTATGTTAWSIADIPLQPGTNVLTVTATDTDGQPGPNERTTTLTVTVNEFTYFLSEGATGPFFDLDILLANPNAVPAPVTLTFLKADGTTVGLTQTLPATSRTTIAADNVPGLGNTAVSVVVSSTAALPLVVERSMFWDATYYGSHGGNAVDGAQTRWLFAEGSQGFFDTYVLLANASAGPATATVTFLTEANGPIVHTVTVPATSRLNVYAGAIPALIGKSFSIVVDSTVPIIAERAMYFGTPLFNGGHESAGVTAAATSWFLAEGATGRFFDTFILVGNANATPATVTFTFLTGTGETVVRTKTIAANSRLTVNIEDEDPLLADAAVSTTIAADVPVISERAMYWPGSFTTWHEAHNSFGVTATGTRWGLAEGRVGGARAFETYILLANPAGTPASVRVTFLRGNGTTVVKDYSVPPTSRFNVYVNGMVPELANESFGAVVESTNGVGIAVERAMYNNANGVVWAAGTNVTATRLP